jgi:hypothetical protein
VPRGATRSNRRAHPSRLRWARGFLPSWPCEFDSRHPLYVMALVKGPFAIPPCFCVTACRSRAITRAIGFGATNWPLEPQVSALFTLFAFVITCDGKDYATFRSLRAWKKFWFHDRPVWLTPGARPPCWPGRLARSCHGARPFARVSGRGVRPTKHARLLQQPLPPPRPLKDRGSSSHVVTPDSDGLS